MDTNNVRDPEMDKLRALNSVPSAQKAFCDPNEEPLPLRRELSAPSPFPKEALGPLESVAAKIHEVIQAPMAIVGHSLLAAASFATQALRDVENGGRRSPLSEFFIVVAESGERKTGVDAIVTRPIRLYERELQQKHDAEWSFYQISKDAYLAAKGNITRKSKGTPDVIVVELQKLGDEPTPPLSPILLSDDPTIEGQTKLFEIGQPSQGLFSDEGGKMIGGHGMNAENQLKTAAGMSKLWDGGSITRVRAGDQAMMSKILYGKRMTMSLMVQPVVARQIIGAEILANQGFLARSLIAWPNSTIGDRPYKNVDLSKEEVIAEYENRLLSLLRAPKKMLDGRRNELNPDPIRLGKKAEKLWTQFHDEIEHHLRDGGKYEQIRGFGAKAAEHALRLAASLSLISNMEASAIPENEMEFGIALARFYLDEALRIKHESTENHDLVLAEKLLLWLRAQKNKVFYLSQVYVYGPGQIRNATAAKKIVGILEAHGYLVPQSPTILKGSLRKEVWMVK